MLPLFLVSILFPLFTIALLWRRVRKPLIGWFATFFLALGVTGFSVLAAPWQFFGVPLRLLIAVLFVIAVVMSLRRAIPADVPREGVLRTASKVFIGVFFGSVAVGVLAAYDVPDGAIDAGYPLRGGTFIVGHGGSTTVANQHYVHPSQRYALDVVALNAFGTRARGFFPKELSRYAIYGKEVLAPCDGVVVAAVNELPDQTPPNRDEKNLAGNHIALRCGDAIVYLAHLQRGSVTVAAGMQVARGAVVGRVGNSGNTTEPHLHVHAERGGKGLNTAPGVPMTFGGRWLVRNSVFRHSGRTEGRP